MKMPFGRYRGELLGNIPTDYLEWAKGIVTSERLLAAITGELADREFRAWISPPGLLAWALGCGERRG